MAGPRPRVIVEGGRFGRECDAAMSERKLELAAAGDVPHQQQELPGVVGVDVLQLGVLDDTLFFYGMAKADTFIQALYRAGRQAEALDQPHHRRDGPRHPGRHLGAAEEQRAMTQAADPAAPLRRGRGGGRVPGSRAAR